MYSAEFVRPVTGPYNRRTRQVFRFLACVTVVWLVVTVCRASLRTVRSAVSTCARWSHSAVSAVSNHSIFVWGGDSVGYTPAPGAARSVLQWRKPATTREGGALESMCGTAKYVALVDWATFSPDITAPLSAEDALLEQTVRRFDELQAKLDFKRAWFDLEDAVEPTDVKDRRAAERAAGAQANYHFIVLIDWPDYNTHLAPAQWTEPATTAEILQQVQGEIHYLRAELAKHHIGLSQAYRVEQDLVRCKPSLREGEKGLFRC